MVQHMTNNFWQAEARKREIKKLIHDIKRITRRKLTAEENIRIVVVKTGEGWTRHPDVHPQNLWPGCTGQRM